MFDNIGGKIKTTAAAIAWIGIVCSVLFGIVAMAGSFLAGLIYIVAGCLISWVGSFAFYGFGVLIEETAESRALLDSINTQLHRNEAMAQPNHGTFTAHSATSSVQQNIPAWKRVEMENESWKQQEQE